jgi:hypothetical protein
VCIYIYIYRKEKPKNDNNKKKKTAVFPHLFKSFFEARVIYAKKKTSTCFVLKKS